MKLNKLAMLALLATSLIADSAFSATDGSVGATSTGTAVISVTIPKLIRARGFADYSFGTYTGTGDLNANEDLNISANYSGTYRVTATASGGAFTLSNGTDTIAYNAYFNDATGTSGRNALTYNTALTGQSGATTTLGSTTDNANLSIEVLEANLQAVVGGGSAHTSTITLVFAPE